MRAGRAAKRAPLNEEVRWVARCGTTLSAEAVAAQACVSSEVDMGVNFSLTAAEQARLQRAIVVVSSSERRSATQARPLQRPPPGSVRWMGGAAPAFERAIVKRQPKHWPVKLKSELWVQASKAKQRAQHTAKRCTRQGIMGWYTRQRPKGGLPMTQARRPGPGAALPAHSRPAGSRRRSEPPLRPGPTASSSPRDSSSAPRAGA